MTSILFSTVIVISSIFWTKDIINSQKELSDVQIGFPLEFISQDQTRYDPEYPYEASFTSPWESPTRLHLSALIGSLALSISMMTTALYAIRLFTKRRV